MSLTEKEIEESYKNLDTLDILLDNLQQNTNLHNSLEEFDWRKNDQKVLQIEEMDKFILEEVLDCNIQQDECEQVLAPAMSETFPVLSLDDVLEVSKNFCFRL